MNPGSTIFRIAAIDSWDFCTCVGPNICVSSPAQPLKPSLASAAKIACPVELLRIIENAAALDLHVVDPVFRQQRVAVGKRRLAHRVAVVHVPVQAHGFRWDHLQQRGQFAAGRDVAGGFVLYQQHHAFPLGDSRKRVQDLSDSRVQILRRRSAAEREYANVLAAQNLRRPDALHQVRVARFEARQVACDPFVASSSIFRPPPHRLRVRHRELQQVRIQERDVDAIVAELLGRGLRLAFVHVKVVLPLRAGNIAQLQVFQPILMCELDGALGRASNLVADGADL